MNEQVLKSTNMHVVPKKDNKVIAKLPTQEKEALVAYAASRDIPVAQIIREAIREKLEKLGCSVKRPRSKGV